MRELRSAARGEPRARVQDPFGISREFAKPLSVLRK